MLMILYVFLIVNQMQTKCFEFLNTQHPNIKFTFEKQINKKISFLNVLFTNDGDQFCTSVFHKETTIGLFTN